MGDGCPRSAGQEEELQEEDQVLDGGEHTKARLRHIINKFVQRNLREVRESK